MRIFLFLLLMLTTIAPVFSQSGKLTEHGTELNHDQKAKELIDQVCTEYESYKSMKVNFILTSVVNGYSRSVDTIRGQVQDDQYRLSMPGQEIACNGETVWYYNRVAKTITKAQPDQSQINLAYPHKMLRRYQNEYNYKWMGEAKLGKHVIQKIDFLPKGKSGEITKIRVYIDKSSSQILSITTYGKNGTNYKLDFRNVLYNVKIDPKTFVLEMS